jgi:hypothetical protein
MRKFNYIFLGSGGAAMWAKTGIYAANPGIRPQAAMADVLNTGNQKFNHMKLPIGDTSGYWGQRMLEQNLFLENADGEMIIIDEAIITLTQKKNIVSTSIIGGKGTVKEFITSEDIEIKISAALVALDDAGNIIDEYPEEGVRALRKILDSEGTISTRNTNNPNQTSKFLAMFDIDRIVITDYSITDMGYSNRQEISIDAVSDYDYTIYSEEA